MKSFSIKAVHEFVRFLYGFELEQEDVKNDLELVKDLIGMGGFYNVTSIPTAAVIFLTEHLNTDNMLDWMDFLKTHNARNAVALCSEFLVTTFDHNKLHSTGMVSKHPEIAVQMVKNTGLKQNTMPATNSWFVKLFLTATGK